LTYSKIDYNLIYCHNFYPRYYIDKIKYIEQDNNGYYIGCLYTFRKDGQKMYINTMENEKKKRVTINPIRLDFLTIDTLSIIAGYNKDVPDNFWGELTYDLYRHSICNVNPNSKDMRYSCYAKASF